MYLWDIRLGFQGFFLFFTKSQSASLLYNYFEKGCAFIMSKKLTFRGHSTQTYAEVFRSFISAKTAQGVADITIRNYHNNLHIVVNGFHRCFNTFGSKELLDAVGVLGMLFCGVGVEKITDVKELHALSRRTPAPCRPLYFLLLVQFPKPFDNLLTAQSPLSSSAMLSPPWWV